MIDDRIGSIGSTQGVNDSATPIAKNAATMSQKRPLCSTLSTALPSNHDDAVLLEGVAPPGVEEPPALNAAPVVGPASRLAAVTRALPSPPNAVRLICAALVIGG
jgi:hypothetical protein